MPASMSSTAPALPLLLGSRRVARRRGRASRGLRRRHPRVAGRRCGRASEHRCFPGPVNRVPGRGRAPLAQHAAGARARAGLPPEPDGQRQRRGTKAEGRSFPRRRALLRQGLFRVLSRRRAEPRSGVRAPPEHGVILLYRRDSRVASFVNHVVAALGSDKPSTRTEATMALAELCNVGSGGKARKEVGEAMPRLVWMLAALVTASSYWKLFKKDEMGIVNVVQLLDPVHRAVDNRFPLSVLLAVSQSRRCRKQMVAAGACGFLQGLVAAEVDGAKKLSELLGRGKMLGMFPLHDGVGDRTPIWPSCKYCLLYMK